MLVYGQTFMGQKCSSYDYTMGFGVSAQGDVCAALQSVTPPHLLCKINKLIGNSEALATFVRTKVTKSRWDVHQAGKQLKGIGLRLIYRRLTRPTKAA